MKIENLSLKPGSRQGGPFSSLSIVLEVLVRAFKQKGKKKKSPSENESSKSDNFSET